MQKGFQSQKHISQSAAAEFLDVTEQTITQWLHARQLRAFRLHHITRIIRTDFEQFLEKHTDTPVGEKAKQNV
jgi:excisionase family DNA binding protein